MSDTEKIVSQQQCCSIQNEEDLKEECDIVTAEIMKTVEDLANKVLDQRQEIKEIDF